MPEFKLTPKEQVLSIPLIETVDDLIDLAIVGDYADEMHNVLLEAILAGLIEQETDHREVATVFYLIGLSQGHVDGHACAEASPQETNEPPTGFYR